MLFYSRFLKSITEAEVDGQPTEGSDQPNADYAAEQDTQVDQYTSQNNDMPPEDMENPPQDIPADEPPPDYTEMGDDGSEGGSNDAAPPPEEPESAVDDIKKQEEELYNELTPEQLDIKHKELKSQYLAMYDIIISIIDRIGDLNVAEENIGVVEYTSNTLAKLKDMVTDYVNSVYQTKSYIENSINYNRFLAVLNGINKILEEMNSKNAQN